MVPVRAAVEILLKWIYRTEAKRLLDYERRIARRFSHSLVCTVGEQRDFQRLFPGVAVSLVGTASISTISGPRAKRSAPDRSSLPG